MNTKQSTEIIKMYAETIEAESDVKARIRQIERLKDTFGAEIADCEIRLREYAEKKNYVGVLSAFEVRDAHSPSPTITPPIKTETAPTVKPMKTYSPKTPEELEAERKEFDTRLMYYTVMMSLVDRMYKQEKITIERYYLLQDIFSEFYGFTEKSLFYWDGPKQSETTTSDNHKRSRKYTRRNIEYWEQFKKKNSKS